MTDTLRQYDKVVDSCREIFRQKIKDYGSSWRVLRPISIADQIYIKAQRIRHIQLLGKQKVEDAPDNELRAIINYGIIALIQLTLDGEAPLELSAEEATGYYSRMLGEVKRLMEDKNHDYGEAWREMSQESFIDLILMKLLRIRSILKNQGKTLVSEGIDANFRDIVNYAVFSLIKMQENQPDRPLNTP
ncbi:MAG TPA: DUF1599 domain-containing protein [Chitinophagaceae bacterium]|nr:DUF1599 domain-containing protein [Chitinophagaceae bacterium]